MAAPPTHHPSTTTPIPFCSSMDPRSGYCSATKSYRSLRPQVPLPPEAASLSVTDYIFSLLSAADDFSPSATILIDAAVDASLSYADFLRRVDSLSLSLSSSLSAGDVALILCPSSLHVPVLYFALLSLGVVVSPANPLSTQSELTHLVELARPSFIFSVSSMAPKLRSFNFRTIFVDLPEFDSMLTHPSNRPRISFSQSDTAAILYSSGTTGRVKGVELTHRNLIALIAGFYHVRTERKAKNRPICLFTLPLFHVFGFFMLLRAVSMAETMVVMPRFDFEKMLAAIEKYRVVYMPVSPPLVVAVAKSELTDKYDLSSLESLGCGGASLGKEVAERFKARFPNVDLTQSF